MNYTDIFGWFPAESAALLEGLMRDHDVKSVIEIGAFIGRSTVFFAEQGAHVITIDPFTKAGWNDANGDIDKYGGEDFFEKFVANVEACGVSDKVTVVRTSSKEAAPMLGARKVDLVYIDGAHDYESVKQDIGLWFSNAYKIICGDDYDENWPGVKKAVDELVPDRIINGRVWYKII